VGERKKIKNIRNIDSYTSIFREDKAETACRKYKYKSTKHLPNFKDMVDNI
jgi:hypothetical protein